MSIIYGNDKSKTWKLVNEISHRKRKKGCSINAIVNKDGIRLTDPQDIANCLNDHLGTVGANMAGKFDDSAASETDVQSRLIL